MKRGIKNYNILENVEIYRLLKRSGFYKDSHSIWKRSGKNKNLCVIVDVSFVEDSVMVKGAIEKLNAVLKKECYVFIVNDSADDNIVNCEKAVVVVLDNKNGIAGQGRLSGSVCLDFVTKNGVEEPGYVDKVVLKLRPNNCVKVTAEDSHVNIGFVNEDLLDAVIMDITFASNRVDDSTGGFNMIEVKDYVAPFSVSNRMYGYFKEKGLCDFCLEKNLTRLQVNAKEKCLLFFDGYNDVVPAVLRQFSEDIHG